MRHYILAFIIIFLTGLVGCVREDDKYTATSQVAEPSQPFQPKASRTEDWYKISPIFVRGDGFKVCEQIEAIPRGLWGDSRKVRVDESISADGDALLIRGMYETGEVIDYVMYRSLNKCTADSSAAEVINSSRLLLQEIDKANSKCRSLPSDSNEGTEACSNRDRLMQQAERAGWCWGPQEAYGYEKHWIKCVDDPARMAKHQWFAHDVNHAHCQKSRSPADKIRELQDFGKIAQTNDIAAGAVEVEVNIGNGKSEVWTFYRTSESCEASLPRSQKIDSKYE